MLKKLFIAATFFITTPAFALSATTAETPMASIPSDTRILNFASEAALATFSYGFNDINKKLPELASYFSSDAWQKYYSTLKTTGQVDRIINNQFVVRSTQTKKPTILASGRDNPEHTWLVQVPLFIQYVSASDKVAGDIIITMAVAPAPHKPKNGLEIRQFVIETVSKEKA